MNKVTLESIQRKIIGATYTVLPDGRTTVCQLTLENGFTVNGVSACVDRANFDKAKGEHHAHEDAVDKIWQLEGYLLAERMYQKLFETKRPLESRMGMMKPTTNMDFGDAIAALKAGLKVARAGWNGKGMWLNLQVPDAHSKMTLPYIYMFTADKHQVPWLASQTDVLSSDWSVVP